MSAPIVMYPNPSANCNSIVSQHGNYWAQRDSIMWYSLLGILDSCFMALRWYTCSGSYLEQLGKAQTQSTVVDVNYLMIDNVKNQTAKLCLDDRSEERE
jgi:hypothetical protein